MRHRNSWVIISICVLFLNGCAIFQDYTRKSAPARLAVSIGDYAGALNVFPPSAVRGGDKILIRMERGTLLQDMGKFKDSTVEFEAAAALIEAAERRAVISASRTAAEAATLIINEKTLPYEGADFEKIFIHTYDALNYLMLKDLGGARVEIRNAYRRQQELQDRHYRELEQARKEARASEWEGLFAQAEPGTYERLAQSAQDVQSIYQNAFAYYISALVYELNKETDEAYIDLKKAYDAAPRCRFIQRDLLRLSRSLHYGDDFERWKTLFGAPDQAPQDGIDIFVIFEAGLAPYKEQLTIPIPTASGLFAAAFPVYQFSPSSVLAGRVRCGEQTETTCLVSDTDAIAARNLLDQFPILFAKQIARTTLKAVATHQIDRRRGAGTAFLANILALITEQADLRTWSTLPKQVQIARLTAPPGTSRVEIAALPGGGERSSLDIPAGTKHFIILARAPDGVLTIQSQAY